MCFTVIFFSVKGILFRFSYFKKFILNNCDLNHLKLINDKIINTSTKKYKNCKISKTFRKRIKKKFYYFIENSEKYKNCFSFYISVIIEDLKTEGLFYDNYFSAIKFFFGRLSTNEFKKCF